MLRGCLCRLTKAALEHASCLTVYRRPDGLEVSFLYILHAKMLPSGISKGLLGALIVQRSVGQTRRSSSGPRRLGRVLISCRLKLLILERSTTSSRNEIVQALIQ